MIKYRKPSGTVIEVSDTSANRAYADSLGWVEDGAAEVKKAPYTHEQLLNIGERDGMEGLRAIGDPLNVKSTSKEGLISAILTAQVEQ